MYASFENVKESGLSVERRVGGVWGGVWGGGFPAAV